MTGRRYINSSSFVMAMLFTILCGAVALSLGYFIDYFARGHFGQNTRAVIDSEIRYLDERENHKSLPSHPHRLYLPMPDDGAWPDGVEVNDKENLKDIIIFDYLPDGLRYAGKIHNLGNGENILVAYDITDIAQDFSFMQMIGVASIVFVMIVVFISYLISVFVVKGTNKIAGTAREIIDTGNLSRRIDIGSHWDDLGNMTDVLNMLLARIEQLMNDVRQVSDNIAHDLRTPLTRLRHKMEGLPDNHALLKEADQILSTFNALLRISRIETEKQRSRFQDLNLRDVLKDVADFYDPLAEEKAILLRTNLQSVNYHGDRDLLFQAFANLVDNAVKYTPKGGVIDIKLWQEEKNIYIEILDSGSGVQDKDLEKIFDRFYRSEACRSTPGTGLGLSLVAAVIGLHHGRVFAKNTDKGFGIITIL